MPAFFLLAAAVAAAPLLVANGPGRVTLTATIETDLPMPFLDRPGDTSAPGARLAEPADGATERGYAGAVQQAKDIARLPPRR